MRKGVVYFLVAGLCLSFGSVAVWAGALLQDSRNTCTTDNCASQRIRGFYERAQPWVVLVQAVAGECLRLHVTRQTADLEMAVLSPDVQENHWVDDDSGGSLRPLIKIDPTPVTGWYVVVVSHVLGSSTRENFDLRYGRYPTGNANCTNPTLTSAPISVLLGPDDTLKSAP